ncbi:MAG: pre-peptidase C-terminal domain-containing protein [Thermomicrobiales bacterium]
MTAMIAAAGLTGAAGAQAALRGVTGAAPRPAANPYAPAAGHSYRHGALPTIGRQRRMNRWAATHAVTPAASRLNLSYGGGVHGVGVTSGHEKVYLVFWGSQWGASSTNSHGDITLANDPSSAAPYLQDLFKGLGTSGERWSGVMTQYCDGVPYNSHSCPANAFHVAYPAGGALAGVWVDKSTAAPDTATGDQIGSEAVKAARHFGNTTQASNRDTQYAIISPTGTHPDGFGTTGGFCAWHDDSADPNLPGRPVNSKLDVAFTNMPYVTDLGISCGENFVNGGTQGVTDGFSIVLGHEYAETITDQLPAFGWTNPFSEGENADLCAWNPPDTVGGTNDLTLSTGTFAMQSTWANDNKGGGCAFTHRIVTDNWVLNGGFETGTFAHWKTAGAATAIVTSGTHGGKHAARLGKSTATDGNSSITQTFTAHGPALTFWYNGHCPDTITESWATATLTDNTAHSSVTILPKTCTAHAGWQRVSHTVVAGHSYTLKVVSHDDNDVAHGDGNSPLVDDVVNR